MESIGDYALHVVETGRFRLDGGAMFGIIPRPLWEKKITPDERNRIQLNMRCLLLKGTDRLILIDAGIGHKYDDKFKDIFAIEHDEYSICKSFDELGISTEDVTDVILTHLHFDHCGGCTYNDENGGYGLTFPNAQHHVQRRHWEWARSSNPKEAGSFLEENIEPLAASGQLSLVDEKQQLFDGVHVHPINGHTEAQQMVRITDAENTLIYAADLLPTRFHLKDAWTMAYDVDPLSTIDEKQYLLKQAAEKGWHIFFEHDPHVQVANVEMEQGKPITVNERDLIDD